MTTLDELITELEDARNDMGGDTEVRIAFQQNWPLRGTVDSVTIPDKDMCPGCGEDADHDGEECPEAPIANDKANDHSDNDMLWIAVGSAPYAESGYAPKWAWRS